MRVLVCGGRHYGSSYTKWPCHPETREEELANEQEAADERALLVKMLDSLNITVLIAGGANGADKLAERWADANGVKKEIYPVTPCDWGKFGKSAGYLRNKKMLDVGKPDKVVVFPGGKGTALMRKLALMWGVEVIEA